MIIATLSPSVMAVDETFSTLNYAQQAHGIQNKPVATSYLKMGPDSEIGKKAQGTEGSVAQDWHEMECRLSYMQSQVENAQAALARKHQQQEAIEKRADAAEREASEAREALETEKAESAKLRDELALKEREAQVATPSLPHLSAHPAAQPIPTAFSPRAPTLSTSSGPDPNEPARR